LNLQLIWRNKEGRPFLNNIRGRILWLFPEGVFSNTQP
jgi:hypothetical protein